MVPTSSDLFNSIMFIPREEQKADEERLDQVLKSWKQSRRSISRHGNCLFYSVAYNLKMQLERGNNDLEQILTNVAIHVHESLSQIASALRKGVVNQWLGEHSECYQIFMTKGQLQTQAEEFIKDGTYSSDVGDLTIAALSNMLQIPVVLFTSTLLKMGSYSNTTMCQYWDNHLIY